MKELKAVKQGIEIRAEIFENRCYITSNYPLILQAFRMALGKKDLKFEQRGKWIILTNKDSTEQQTYEDLITNLKSGGFEIINDGKKTV